MSERGSISTRFVLYKPSENVHPKERASSSTINSGFRDNSSSILSNDGLGKLSASGMRIVCAST
jgi:hypothetical protein